MFVEPLDIPILYGRIAIASAALIHALFATFIVGSSFIGAATETIGHLRGNRHFERLSRLIAFTLILTTAGISFFGVILVFLLNIFWPHFWSTLFRIMFWPLLFEACFFLGEAICAYAWYYSWDWSRSGNRPKQWHLAFGWGAAICSLIAMVMIDIVASYMLTPRPPDRMWQAIFNPTMLYLDTHRIVGNMTWTGLGLAALCAASFLRSRTDEDRSFYRWAGGVCFTIGFGAALVMPAIGYQYLLQVRYSEPQAFYTVMLGPRSWLFNVVALLYGLIAVCGSLYILRILQAGSSPDSAGRIIVPVSLAVLIVAGLVFAMPYHLQHLPFLSHLADTAINPLGKMQPNKYFAIAALVFFGLLNWVLFVRSFGGRAPWWKTAVTAGRERLNQTLLIMIAGCAILTMLSMGWVRETARAYNGYLIYGVMTLSDEQPTYERRTADRGMPQLDSKEEPEKRVSNPLLHHTPDQ
jgi:cytochrome bd ubiquinol oxidase subunit I